MNRRILGIVAIVVLVSTAGCAGILGSGDSSGDGSDNESVDGETTETTNSLEDVEYPDGVTQEGFGNASAIADVHESTLANTSYALELSQNTSQGNQTGSTTIHVRSNIETQQMVVSSESVRDAASMSEPQEYSNVMYQNATHQHTNLTMSGSSQTSVQESPTDFETSHESQASAGLVEFMITTGEYSATETVNRDGTTLVRYEMDEYNATEDDNLNVSNADGFILVSEAGVVHEAGLSLEGTNEGTEVAYDIRMEVTQVGNVTVDQPSWVDEA